MSAAVLGLFFLQFGWLRNVHQLTERKFGENVQVALNKTAIDLEKFEMVQMMNPEVFDQGVEGWLDDYVKNAGYVLQSQESISLRDTTIFADGEVQKYLLVQGNLIDTATGLRASHRVLTPDLRQLDKMDIYDSLLMRDTNSLYIQWDESFEAQINKKTFYLNYLIERMFTTNPVDDISLRLNLKMLDSLLAVNLNASGIDTNYTFNILRDTSVHHKFKQTSANYDVSLTSAEHSVTLYPNDVIPSEYKLLVTFPGQNLLVWKDMAGTIFASIFLVLIVMFAFFFAVRTIYQQKQLSEIKNDFISNMTHELKTPISTISLACEAVRDPDLQNNHEMLSSFIGMIDTENKRLGKLVENVLQTALIDKGKLKLNREKSSIDQLLKQVVDSFQIRYRDKGGSIIIDKADAIEFAVDRIHFSNVIFNLLDNSLKYNQNQPEVHIVLSKLGEGFTIEVIDNGIGIRKEDQKRIFEKLYRVPTGNVHDVKGFGLGLSYVSSIVSLHKGKINLKSTPGKGSTFKISFNHE